MSKVETSSGEGFPARSFTDVMFQRYEGDHALGNQSTGQSPSDGNTLDP